MARLLLLLRFSVVVVMTSIAALSSACAPQGSLPAASSQDAAANTPAVTTTQAPQASSTKAPASSPTSATQGKPAGAPIRIGHLTMLSGPLAMYGAMESDAIALALDDINNSGGINGSPLEVVRYDTGGDPQQAVGQFRKLADQDKVLAVLGPFNSGEFEVTAPLAVEDKVPSLSIAGSPGIAANNRPWAFQIHIPFAVLAPPTVDAFLKKYPNVKSIAIAGDTSYRASESEVKDIYPAAFKDRGLRVADTVEFETTTTDFSAVVSRIKALDADALFVSGIPGPAFGLLKELERQGFKKPLLLSGMLGGGGSVIPLMGSYLNGTVISYWLDFNDKATQDWESRWLSSVNADARVPQKPLFASTDLSVYNAIMALARTMREAGITPDTPLTDARSKIKDGLTGLKDFQSVGPKITVLPTGEWTWAPMPFIVEKGQPVLIK